MRSKKRNRKHRLLGLFLAALMAISLFPAAGIAATKDYSGGSYRVELTASPSGSTATVGDTVTLTAKVYKGGTEITDLEANGLVLYFWVDAWGNCNSDATTANGYSTKCDVSGSTGTSLTATVMFNEAAKFSIVAQLKYTNANDNLYLADADFTVSAESEDSSNGVTLKNADFELGTKENWTVTPSTLKVEKPDTGETDPTYGLNFWADSGTDEEISYEIQNLVAGTYKAQISAYGMNSAGQDTGLDFYIVDASGNQLTTPVNITANGWQAGWTTVSTGTFKLDQAATVKVMIKGTLVSGAWGTLDNLVVTTSTDDSNSGDDDDDDDDVDTSKPANIEVEKVKNLDEDFIMGMDISTIVSEYNSGVKYKDFDGNTLSSLSDFCKFIASCGVNSVRVRVWNDPYKTGTTSTYGAGICDVATAKTIAAACKEAGISLLVDFHYSDFWADPAKYSAPKAWEGYTVEQKVTAVYNFTYESLKEIASTGATISMVQVGNEINGGVCGILSSDVESMCKIFSSGSKAVRDFSEYQYSDRTKVKVAIHVAEPQKSAMTTWAANLKKYNVDYDALGTSYYVFWHGTLSNLKSQMSSVKNNYGKDVFVAETSYLYTTADTDGQENGVSVGVDDEDAYYEVSPQGQADVVRDIINAVNEVGGLGVYYWEPAWITVGDTTGKTGDALTAQIAANNVLWETYGSGWASSAAIGYDSGATEETYGGSQWDNQALFAADGSPLESMHVWEYVKYGTTVSTLSVTGVEEKEIELEAGESYTLPTKVKVYYNKPSVGRVSEEVTWNADDVAKVDTTTVGTYTVNGTVTLSQDCTDGTKTKAAVCTVTVKTPNLITNKNAAGMEDANLFTVDGSGVTVGSTQDILAGDASMHWWSETATTTTVTYNTPISLEAGSYTLEADAMGYSGDEVSLLILDADGNVLYEGDSATLTGYSMESKKWQKPTVSFTLDKATDIKVRVKVKIQDTGWGSVDSLYLYQTASAEDLANEAAADEVEALVNALPTTLTLSNETSVAAARAAYNSLSEAQKALVSSETLAALEKAEAQIAALKKAAAAQKAAEEQNDGATETVKKKTSVQTTTDSSATGDNAPVGALVIVLAGAAAVAAVTVRRRRHA